MNSRRLTNHRSVPILKVTETIGLLPLLVDINEAVIQDVLKQSYEEAYAHLVIELSSIRTINFDELSKMILGLEYIGVDVIASGLHPATVLKNNRDNVIPIDTYRCFPDLYQALISLDVPMEPRKAER